MAKGKKAAATLTPEEKLQQALVPIEEQPYEIPTNWNWVRFDRATINYDSKRIPLSTKQRSALEKIYDYYGASGVIDKVDNYIFDQELLLIGEDGANLLSRSTPIAFLASGKYWVNNHAHTLDSSAITTRTFLCNYINSIDLAPYVTGSAQPKLTQDKMNAIPVPIPPLTEQQRIVDRIESIFAKLDEAKEKAQAVVDGFELRKSAILHKAFTGELTAQWRQEHGVGLNSWVEAPLGDYSTSQYGYTEKSSVDEIGPHFLRITDIQDGKVLWNEVPYCKIDDETKEKYVLSIGDIVVARTGATTGKSYMVMDDVDSVFASYLIRVSISKKELLAPEHLYLFMQSPKYWGQIMELSQGIAQPGVNGKKLQTLTLPVPSMEEQLKIVELANGILPRMDQSKEAAETVLDQIDTMKKSVLARAFRGELGTNDPAEESAMELLKSVL